MLKLYVLAAGAAEWMAGIAVAGVLGAYGAIFMLHKAVGDHEKKANIHPDGDHLVWDSTCAERVKRIEQALAATNQTIVANASATHDSLEEIKALIREESRKQANDRSS